MYGGCIANCEFEERGKETREKNREEREREREREKY